MATTATRNSQSPHYFSSKMSRINTEPLTMRRINTKHALLSPTPNALCELLSELCSAGLWNLGSCYVTDVATIVWLLCIDKWQRYKSVSNEKVNV